MKFLVTADVHGNWAILDKIYNYIISQNINYVFFAGDICPKIHGKTLNELTDIHINFMRTFWEYCRKIYEVTNRKTMPYYIFGNDDWVDKEMIININDVWYFQKNTYKKDALYDIDNNSTFKNFRAFEYVNITPFNTNRECNENKLQYELNKIKINSNTIMIAHSPPYRIRDEIKNFMVRENPSIDVNVGSKSVRDVIDNYSPQIWVCGHIHEAFGYEKYNDTHVFNCACDIRHNLFRGFVIETDNEGKLKDFGMVRQ